MSHGVPVSAQLNKAATVYHELSTIESASLADRTSGEAAAKPDRVASAGTISL